MFVNAGSTVRLHPTLTTVIGDAMVRTAFEEIVRNVINLSHNIHKYVTVTSQDEYTDNKQYKLATKVEQLWTQIWPAVIVFCTAFTTLCTQVISMLRALDQSQCWGAKEEAEV